MAFNDQDSDNSNFENLANSLSANERKDLLGKFNGDGKELNVDYDKNVSNVLTDFNEVRDSIAVRINQESFFKKIVLWLKATFANVSVEDIYNQDLIKQLARDVEHNCPGLINYKQKLFKSLFYEKLDELQRVQTVLKKYVQVAEEHEGSFLVELGNVILFDYQAQIRQETDPFKFPKEQLLGPEVRTSLLQQMEELLTKMPASYRTSMYTSARIFEWMKNFCKLPLNDFMAKFSDSGSGKDCLFNQLRGDFANLVKIMGYDIEFNQDVFTALYNTFQAKESEEALRLNVSIDSYLDQAHINAGLVTVFGKSVSIKNLGKIVFENALYTLEPLGGFESWFKKYKAHWKVMFDRRWAERNLEYKRQLILKKMTLYFSLADFVQFPHRPWMKLHTVRNFKYDLTGGFFAYFFEEQYPKHSRLFKYITLEGDFSIKENRQEFTDLLTEYASLSDDISILRNMFSDNGEYGPMFREYAAENPLRKSHFEAVDVALSDAESNLEVMTGRFISASYRLEQLMNAAAGDIKSTNYGPLANFNKIRGLDNAKFRADFDETRESFKYASEILSELQNLESSTES